jgi:hypothetical protein
MEEKVGNETVIYGTTLDHARYHGLEIQRSKEGVRWRHVSKNTERWTKLAKEAKRREVTARILGTLMGTIQYDLQLKETPKATLLQHLEVYSLLGKEMSEKKDWEERVEVSAAQWKEIMSRLDAAADGEWRSWNRPMVHTYERRFVVACDASDKAGAVVLLNENGGQLILARDWTPEEQKESINWREAVMVIEAVEWIIARHGTEGWQLIVAEDNVTALSATNNLFFPKRPDLCGKYLFYLGQLGFGTLRAIYENTKTMPADDPSRVIRAMTNWSEERVGKHKWGLWQSKCKQCYQKMMEHVRTKEDDGRKRARE